ncbi:MAG: (Fe-S)-binding protein [Deltaproteobacteria bacterium]|nr:(Fe-S)-binding protein [Deltaproteobacteria bacterium]
MRIALFVPCYVDQLRPRVGMAALRLLEGLGLEVEFPEAQTCCGQPLLNSGGRREACRLAHRFLDVFANYDRIVCPSASCVATVTRRYRELVGESPRLAAIEERTRELCAFLVEQQGGQPLAGRFPHRVGLHASCHALRELRQGAASELVQPPPADPARQLLASLEGISFAELRRGDECCGFGGAFALEEEAVSRRMGLDRLADHRAGGAEVLASTDVSCLLHLEGLARRRSLPLRAMHVAEILVEALDSA